MLHKNQIEQATITAMSSDGNGIAKIDGMVVFVPYTTVGDQLQVRIVKVQKNFAFGIIDKLLQPSLTEWRTAAQSIKNAVVAPSGTSATTPSCATRPSL